jgi:hypothetical protein
LRADVPVRILDGKLTESQERVLVDLRELLHFLFRRPKCELGIGLLTGLGQLDRHQP